VNAKVQSETLNGVNYLGGQGVVLRVILTLHSHVTCQTGVCMCAHTYVHVHVSCQY
jgi:hypothetical protein